MFIYGLLKIPLNKKTKKKNRVDEAHGWGMCARNYSPMFQYVLWGESLMP